MRLTNRLDVIAFYQLKSITKDPAVQDWAEEVLLRHTEVPKGGSFPAPEFPIPPGDDTEFPDDSDYLQKVRGRLQGFTLAGFPEEAGVSSGKPCSLCREDMEPGEKRFVLELINRSGVEYVYWLCSNCETVIRGYQELFTFAE